MASSRAADRVWYAAYGSNIERERFRLYLDGGTHPLTGRVTPGCRDRTGPADDRAIELPHPVLFARHSLGWDGAIAFLDSDTPGRALGRAWLITPDQLLDVMAQECGREPGTMPEGALHDIGPDRHTVAAVPEGWYGRLVWCGDLDGVPILTCTADWALRDEVPAPPSSTYLSTIARGLAELGHPRRRIVDYLGGLAGVQPTWTPTDIGALVPG